MRLRSMRIWALAVLLGTGGAAWAQEASQSLLEVSGSVPKNLAPSSEQVTLSASQNPAGVLVTIAPGKEGYPGVTLTPAQGKTWDLSKYGHIEATVTNTGDKPLSLGLRVDDTGDWKSNPWNAENAYLKPGETKKALVRFGYSWGKPAHKLKSSDVARVLLFAGKSKAEQTFRIESVVAGGVAGEKPPVKPESIRTTPRDGVLLGSGVKVDADKQLQASKATASLEGQALRIALPREPAKTVQWVAYQPAVGRWDLRDSLEVRMVLKNTGQAALTPRACVTSNHGPTDWIEAKAPLAPGAQVELVIPFISATPWNGEDAKKSGDQLDSTAVSGIRLAVNGADEARELTIESIRADVPPAAALPAWLGKRPPVEGDWTQTFNDDFNEKEIDASKWNVTGENYWDKQSHFSHVNTIIGDGVVKLRFEKKHGHQNDDPNHKRVTDYATGYLDTYGKWTQKYGYFEARMKLPTAPGLWPAFWMMPDRGVEAGPQWKRQSTENGGMEFDIMEHLTRWGPYRYNIAMHWNGYGKGHKATGSDRIYFQPDKDGFVTAGVLWTPGELVYYCNGREVGRWKNERISTIPADIMFTLPMGGWDNSPLDDEKLPDDFVIDYVRCWQRADLATSK